MVSTSIEQQECVGEVTLSHSQGAKKLEDRARGSDLLIGLYTCMDIVGMIRKQLHPEQQARSRTEKCSFY